VNQEDTLFTFLPARRWRYRDTVAWLQDEPVSRDGYFVREEFRAEEAARNRLEKWRQEAEDGN
jgi:hypothetical protein